MLIGALLVLPAAAVEPARNPLPEADAVREALAASPELAAMRQGEVALRARTARSGYLASPELRMGFSDLGAELDPDDRRRTNVGLRWSPPRIGELSAKSAMAEARADEADAKMRAAENRIAAEVRLLHRGIAVIDEQIRVAEETVALHRKIVATVAEQVAAGVKTELDRVRAEFDLAEAAAAPARRRTERDVHMARLMHLVGRPGERPALQHTREALLCIPPELERAPLLNAAFARRFELPASLAHVRFAELNLKQAQRQRYPWLSYVQLSRQTSRDQFRAGWAVQAGVELPLFRSRSSIAERADVRRAQLQSEAVKSSIASEVDELTLRLRAAAKGLSGYSTELERLAERQAELAATQLASGASDRLETLLAGMRRLSVRQLYLSRLLEYRALEAGLEQATGRGI